MNTKQTLSFLSTLNSTKNRFFSLYLSKETNVRFETKKHFLVFLLKGSVRFSIDYSNQTSLTSSSVYFVPKETYYEHETLSDAEILVLPLENYADLIRIPHSRLEKEGTSDEVVSYVLPMKKRLQFYFYLLKSALAHGLDDQYFMDLKIRELMMIIEHEYSNTERINLFYPLIEREFDFADFVYANYRKVKNVKELADLSCYSLSGFEKKFCKVFGVSPSKWLKHRITIDIYNDLLNTSVTFKEISLDYGFSTPSHFNNFCKATMGATPGKLRRRIVKPRNFQQAGE